MFSPIVPIRADADDQGQKEQGLQVELIPPPLRLGGGRGRVGLVHIHLELALLTLPGR